MQSFLKKDDYINSKLMQLKENYEKSSVYVDIKFVLEEKEIKNLKMQKRFKEKDQLITIFNYLKNEIGFFNNLKVYYYSKEKEDKVEINFKQNSTIKQFLNINDIPNENNYYVLKYDYSPGKYDPLFLC
jgi:hypothetical protein